MIPDNRHRSLTVGVLLAVAGCGSATPGARPDDMSAAHHARAAEGHEAEGEQHASRYDETARVVHERCGSGPAATAAAAPCWSWMTNPTEDHLHEAEEHRRMAADHRAASQALRDAEARSCVGVDDMDRDMCPLMNRGDIVRVEPQETTVQMGRATQRVLNGAAIEMRAVPGLTGEWLQTVLECHVARAAVLGHDEEMPNCPLAPAGAQVRVMSAGDGFRIEITSTDVAQANEILRRAQTLAPGA